MLKRFEGVYVPFHSNDGDDEDKRERAVTLSSEMEALKKEDAGEIDDTCACLTVGTH